MGKRRRWPWILFAICLLVIVGFAVTRASAGQSTGSPVPAVAPSVVPLTTFGEGDYVVGRQIEPGTYRTTGPASNDASCSWSRRKDLSNNPDSIIAYKVSRTPETVTILRSDAGFSTSGCDPWLRIGD